MAHRTYIHIIGLVVTVILVQLATFYTDAGYYLTQLTMSAYYLLVIVGLCLLMGYTGQISLGHAGFFAIGGYCSALMTTFNLLPYQHNGFIMVLSKLGALVVREDLYGVQILHAQPWLACVVSVLAASSVAYVIGGPGLKLKGHYLAMATLGFGIIVFRVVLGTSILGEADGLSDVPGFKLIPGLEVSGRQNLRITNYYIAWGMVVLGVILVLNLVGSRVGRALRSIHGDEEAAGATGIDTAKYKLNTFVLSAAFAAIAGVFLTHYNGGIGPSEACIMKSVRYVAIVAVGGMANLWGALLMGALLNFLSLRGFFGSFDDAVFGGILILIMLFSPEGLVRADVLSRLKKIFKNRKTDDESP